MSRPIVHFDIIGADPERLRGFYAELFDWHFDVDDDPAPGTEALIGDYGVVEPAMSSAGVGIPAGVDGGAGISPRTNVYVGVPDVEAALQSAERLGARRLTEPHINERTGLIVALFVDPEGNIVGLANVT